MIDITELTGVTKHANQHRLSRLIIEAPNDELRQLAVEVEQYTDQLIEELEKAQQRIDELENDEVRQRLANAEHQLYMAELAKHNLKASRKAQFRKRKASEKRIAELEAQNEYIRKRYQQLDLLIGKNILVMQAAIIEWQATGDAKNGLAWIYNTLFGPGELPDEAEKDAQAYFDRKYAPLDEELMALHKWFWEQSEAERAAAGIKVEAE
ncbi:ead/Ea22-like family protein [Klebsiella variicola]|uniref:ead/Ea22-like family protein n=1 Tax=Klebsiella variicola TaxID=244366 RepID=UPI003D97F35B